MWSYVVTKKAMVWQLRTCDSMALKKSISVYTIIWGLAADRLTADIVSKKSNVSVVDPKHIILGPYKPLGRE